MAEDENTVETSTTETTEVADATSAETENTEVEATTENAVPQSRFTEVVNERNAAQEELGALKSRIDALEKPEPEPVEEEPGETATDVERAQWLVRKTVEDSLGMSLADAKAKLGKVESASKSAELVRWENACSKAGVDPNNTDVQAMAMGYGNADATANIDEILVKVAKFVQPKAKPAASVETETQTGPNLSSDWLPKNAADAREGAAKGKLAKQLSSTEIIARRMAARG